MLLAANHILLDLLPVGFPALNSYSDTVITYLNLFMNKLIYWNSCDLHECIL